MIQPHHRARLLNICRQAGPARRPVILGLLALLAISAGCHRWLVSDADRRVRSVVSEKQDRALGHAYGVAVVRPPDPPFTGEQSYDINPHPLSDDLPEKFRRAPSPEEMEPLARPRPFEELDVKLDVKADEKLIDSVSQDLAGHRPANEPLDEAGTPKKSVPVPSARPKPPPGGSTSPATPNAGPGRPEEKLAPDSLPEQPEGTAGPTSIEPADTDNATAKGVRPAYRGDDTESSSLSAAGTRSAAEREARRLLKKTDSESSGVPADEASAAAGEGLTETELAIFRDRLRLSKSIFTEQEQVEVELFSLRDALGYAVDYARELQDAKESLYLAGLDLSLERHLWTPQFAASISADYAHYGQATDRDQTFNMLADVSVAQRLPLGGEVSARIIGNLMHDLRDHVTTGESGQFILSADIPLLRGAGRVAYESRFQAERNLIYAARDFERFRRTFLVDIASDYFNLQQSKASIENAYRSYENRARDLAQAESVDGTNKSRDVFDLPRAKSVFRSAEAALVSAKAAYETALDSFKVRVGMPLDTKLDVVGQNDDQESQLLEVLLPKVTEGEALEAALHYRLDLLNSADQVDDTRRGVSIDRNNLLPDLDLTASATIDSDTSPQSIKSFNLDRTTLAAGVEFRINDRMSERNAYRASLISLRQDQRRHVQFMDRVRADVRRAMRNLRRARDLTEIQALNVEENEFRRRGAQNLYNIGDATNQDKVDAEVDLLNARDDYAQAVANFRIAVLEFRRDTGTLQISDDGKWVVLPLSARGDEEPQG